MKGLLWILAAANVIAVICGQVEKCDDSNCKEGEACILQTIYCLIPPCPEPFETCVPFSKPGTCPVAPPGIFTTCDVTCQSDSECSGDQKCCKYGCSIRCLDPKEEELKPGTCPVSPPGIITTCDVTCQSDSECSGDQKCCNYGCSIRCLDPKVIVEKEPKPGTCPVSPPGIITTCDVRCQSDSECSGDQKCCKYGCSITCLNPKAEVVPKEGVCPASRYRRLSCVIIDPNNNRCNNDEDCPRRQKCCRSGCSLKCVNPRRKFRLWF